MLNSEETSEFHVRLEGVKLSEQAEKRIEAGIQSLVMSELAGYTPNPDDPGTPHRPPHHHFGHTDAVLNIPRDWIGLWLRILAEQEFREVGQIPGIKESLNFKGY